MAASSSSSSNRRPRRQSRRSRNVSVVNVDEYVPDTPSTTCIDLTSDVSGYEVIDLTSGHNITIIDSPVVVLSATDDVGPVRRRRGSGRRGRHRNMLRHRLSSTSQQHVHVLLSEDSDSDDQTKFSHTPQQSGTAASNSFLTTPEGVKVSCPVCLDDVKQIEQSGKQVVSTTCGHVFCDVCIKAAINTQHACPTCRKKLYQRSIHPLFL